MDYLALEGRRTGALAQRWQHASEPRRACEHRTCCVTNGEDFGARESINQILAARCVRFKACSPKSTETELSCMLAARSARGAGKSCKSALKRHAAHRARPRHRHAHARCPAPCTRARACRARSTRTHHACEPRPRSTCSHAATRAHVKLGCRARVTCEC